MLRDELVQPRSTDGTLDNRIEICELLLPSFLFFSNLSLDHVIEDHESFLDDGHLSVELGERTVFDYIKDMASSSSPDPDGLHASIFKNLIMSVMIITK